MICEHDVLHRGYFCAGDIESGNYQGKSYYYCKKCKTVIYQNLLVYTEINEKEQEFDKKVLQDAKEKFKG